MDIDIIVRDSYSDFKEKIPEKYRIPKGPNKGANVGEFRELVGREAKRFRGKHMKTTGKEKDRHGRWLDWIEGVEFDDEDAWRIIEKIDDAIICDLEHKQRDIEFYIAVYYRFHSILKDMSFADNIDDVVFDKPLRDRGKPVFEIAADQLLLEKADSSGAIYTYGYNQDDKIKVLGRQKEQDQLRKFLGGEQKFLWLQLAGSAGQGKSRLAWELIQEAKAERGFNAGFISSETLKAFEDSWGTWEPDCPYLLVVDYVIDRDKSVGGMMATLINRFNTFKHPVRLLLIERQRYDQGGISQIPSFVQEGLTINGDIEFQFSERLHASWFDDLIKDANEKFSNTNLLKPEILFDKHGVLELKRLDDSSLLEIVKQIASAESSGSDLNYSDKFVLDTLKRFDGAGRPLYAYFLGIVLAGNRFENKWEHADLLNYVLTREKEKRWIRRFGEPVPNLEDNTYPIHIAIFATIVRVVDRFQLQQIDEWKNITDRDIERALVLVNGPMVSGIEKPGNIVPGLFPDILGEWFVLSVFRKQANLLPKMLACAWKHAPDATAGFLQRVAQDFPLEIVTQAMIQTMSPDNENYDTYCSVADSVVRALNHAEVENPPEVVIRALKKSAQSNSSAMNGLGFYHWNGYGVPKSDKKSFQCFKKSAKEDHPAGMANLAIAYLRGVGTKRIEEKAFYWAKKAADKENIRGLNILASCYISGIGVVENIRMAMICLQKAADKNDPRSMYELGCCYKMGDGVEKDLVKAAEWFRRAANAGNGKAMVSLGFCLLVGSGVKKDPFKAAEWFREGADAGETMAMDMLGDCYKHGDGVEKDLVKAAEWFNKAREGTNDIQFMPHCVG